MIGPSPFFPLLATVFRESQAQRMQELQEFWPWIVLFCIGAIAVIAAAFWFLMKSGRLTARWKIRIR